MGITDQENSGEDGRFYRFCLVETNQPSGYLWQMAAKLFTQNSASIY